MNVTCRKRNLLQVIIRKVNKEKPFLRVCRVLLYLAPSFIFPRNRSIMIQRHITRARGELLESHKDRRDFRRVFSPIIRSAPQTYSGHFIFFRHSMSSNVAAQNKTLFNFGNIEIFELQLLRQNYDQKAKNWQFD